MTCDGKSCILKPLQQTPHTAGACLISQFAKIQVHCFCHHLCSDRGSSDAFATRLCQCSVRIHVVLLPEAPSESWIQELACKNTVQPAVDLWDVRKQGQTFICKVLWHVSMNLCHCKAHLIEFQVIIPLDCQLILIVFQHSFQWWPHNPGSLLEVGILWLVQRGWKKSCTTWDV